MLGSLAFVLLVFFACSSLAESSCGCSNAPSGQNFPDPRVAVLAGEDVVRVTITRVVGQESSRDAQNESMVYEATFDSFLKGRCYTGNSLPKLIRQKLHPVSSVCNRLLRVGTQYVLEGEYRTQDDAACSPDTFFIHPCSGILDEISAKHFGLSFANPCAAPPSDFQNPLWSAATEVSLFGNGSFFVVSFADGKQLRVEFVSKVAPTMFAQEVLTLVGLPHARTRFLVVNDDKKKQKNELEALLKVLRCKMQEEEANKMAVRRVLSSQAPYVQIQEMPPSGMLSVERLGGEQLHVFLSNSRVQRQMGLAMLAGAFSRNDTKEIFLLGGPSDGDGSPSIFVLPGDASAPKGCFDDAKLAELVRLLDPFHTRVLAKNFLGNLTAALTKERVRGLREPLAENLKQGILQATRALVAGIDGDANFWSKVEQLEASHPSMFGGVIIPQIPIETFKRRLQVLKETVANEL